LPTEDSGAGGNGQVPDEYKWLVKQAEEKLDLAPAEDRDEIVNLMEDLKGVLAAKEMDKAKEIGDELEDILFYIE
jgi:hypothetical protein